MARKTADKKDASAASSTSEPTSAGSRPLRPEDTAFRITAKGAILYVQAILEQKREREFIEACEKSGHCMRASVAFIEFVRGFILNPPGIAATASLAENAAARTKRRGRASAAVARAAKLPPLEGCK